MKINDLLSLKITGRVEENGANTHYRLNDGSIITRKLAVDMLKNGLLKGYEKFEKNGVEYLRDKRDTNKKDNIDKQPLFTFDVSEL